MGWQRIFWTPWLYFYWPWSSTHLLKLFDCTVLQTAIDFFMTYFIARERGSGRSFTVISNSAFVRVHCFDSQWYCNIDFEWNYIFHCFWGSGQCDFSGTYSASFSPPTLSSHVTAEIIGIAWYETGGMQSQRRFPKGGIVSAAALTKSCMRKRIVGISAVWKMPESCELWVIFSESYSVEIK